MSSDIDVQKLFDYLVGAGGLLNGWKYQLYPGGDVLHLFKAGTEEPPRGTSSNIGVRIAGSSMRGETETIPEELEQATTPQRHEFDPRPGVFSTRLKSDEDGTGPDYDSLMDERDRGATLTLTKGGGAGGGGGGQDEDKGISNASSSSDAAYRISGSGAQEVFVFDFGAAVFWGLVHAIYIFNCYISYF